jgi:chromate reductase
MGGFGANHALRQALVYLNVLLLQQPEMYLGDVGALFNAQGEITNEGTRKFLAHFTDTFVKWTMGFQNL